MVKEPEYNQLTPLDWVVLDFTDGMRTFGSLLSFIPTNQKDLAASYIHLRLLGFLTWNIPDHTEMRFGANGYFADKSQPGRSHVRPATRFPPKPKSVSGISRVNSSVSPALSPQDLSDEVCAQYLPPRLFPAFKQFSPTQLDEALDLSVEMQLFTEFLHQQLSVLSPYDLLGLTEGQCTRADVKQAYLLRTRQFHPDRYFRKNLGPFAPELAAIFKAVTAAFGKLQAMVNA